MRILAFAYACEPDKGSEPGAGWMWSRMLAGLGEVWVITRANNREPIEAAIGSIPEASNLHFEYIDLPAWATRWKRGHRGIHLYYLLWQFAALRHARSIVEGFDPDLVWHLTMANAWLGSAAPLLGRPMVFGPVGGGVTPPWRLLPELGIRGTVHEVARTVARGLSRQVNPLAKIAWNRSQLILTLNDETRRWLPTRHRMKAVVMPNAVLDDDFPTSASIEWTTGRTAIYAGNLLPLKAVSLAIRAVACSADWSLLIAGAGRDLPRLRRLAQSLRVAHRVSFLGRLPRDELLEVMAKADVLVFPSLHDESPFVVAEAAHLGLRVICLDRGGAHLIDPAATVIDASGPPHVVTARVSAALNQTTARSALESRDGRSDRRISAVTDDLRSILVERLGAVTSCRELMRSGL